MENNVFLTLIDLAISKEEAACAFYTELAETVLEKEARETLQYIAAEEKQHRIMLVGHRERGFVGNVLKHPKMENDFDITKFLEEPEPGPDIDSKNIYLVAAHREKRAYEFYTFLASVHDNEEIRSFLLTMADEELKHKEKMEYFYSMKSS